MFREGPLMVYDTALEGDLVDTEAETDPAPPSPGLGFPVRTACFHSRWSLHYRNNLRCGGSALSPPSFPVTRHGSQLQQEELSPWLAAKLKGESVRSSDEE